MRVAADTVPTVSALENSAMGSSMAKAAMTRVE
jgi:hypothetical protein